MTAPNSLPVIVIGAGGHAGVLINTLRLLGRRILFATDVDPQAHGLRIDGTEVRGDDETVLNHLPESVELVNGVGSARVPEKRREVFTRFQGRGYRFASVVHPSAVVATSATLGEGVQVMAGAVLQHNVVLGENSVVNTRSSVGHDCVVGRHVHLASGVTVCGGVVIGDMTHVGAGSTIIQEVPVGGAALIGAGSLVLSPVLEGSVVMGVPARVRTGAPSTGAAGDV